MPLSEVINPRRFDDPEWLRYHTALEPYSTEKHVFLNTEGQINRKGYEWTHCIYGLSKLGAITDRSRGLGVGAGREATIFWLADQIAHVTATDLYGNETWSKTSGAEATAEVLANPGKFCPRPFRADHVTFEVADGTKLPFADGSFDFCWSLSSIEHFGGHEAAAAAMREMARVTNLGGIICVATEYLLLPEYRHHEYFNRHDLETYIINASPDLQLVDSMSWELPPLEYLIDSVALWAGVHRRRRHVVLNDGEVQWTSAIMFLRKRDRSAGLVTRLRRKWRSMVAAHQML
jgi:SAM-dependent methyltransferase